MLDLFDEARSHSIFSEKSWNAKSFQALQKPLPELQGSSSARFSVWSFDFSSE